MDLSICLEEGGCAQAMAQIMEFGMLESGLSFHHPAVELRPSDLVMRTFTRWTLSPAPLNLIGAFCEKSGRLKLKSFLRVRLFIRISLH